jgi:high affinity Mn2+ porin
MRARRHALGHASHRPFGAGAPLAACLVWTAAGGQEAQVAPGLTPEPADVSYAVHGQLTYTEQEVDRFRAPYQGTNSLTPDRGQETVDATLYLGYRPWGGAELWVNPEVDQGRGLDNTLGVAGFPSGEAYKVGRNRPYFRLHRLFIRQTHDLSDDAEVVDGGANQLGGSRAKDRWVITVGKMSVTDIFDTNQYAHDPRGDFLNWSAIDAGSLDYAADAWGYTVGAAAELYRSSWVVRGGIFDLSDVPNSTHLQSGFHQFQWLGEVEHHHTLGAMPGKLQTTLYQSYGHMALLADAVAAAGSAGTNPLPASVRGYRSRSGVSLNIEQALTSDIAVFARAGAASGNVEAYEFTDIDRSVVGGLSARGTHWRRAGDVAGFAYVQNRISTVRQEYLDAGGLGILVGDGRLPHAGPESIAEAYYNASLAPWANVSVDVQRISNPAYNRDRGPVSVFAVRVHLQF